MSIYRPLAIIFYRAIDSSEPLLSTICLKERERKNRKKPLPMTVIILLKIQSNLKPDPSIMAFWELYNM